MNFSDAFVDMNDLNKEMSKSKIEDKTRTIHEYVGGKFRTKDLLSGSVVKICSLGGFLLTKKDDDFYVLGNKLTPDFLNFHIMEAAGMSSMMSYLNEYNKDLSVLGENVVKKYKHLSVLHTYTVSVLISGLSIGVEHELSSQRDIVHLSRLTVSKAKAQMNPPLVCRKESDVKIYTNIIDHIKNVITSNGSMGIEERNLLFPTSKASVIILTGSVKNIMKLISLKDAGGKEDELIEILEKLDETMKTILPDVF